MNGEVLHSDKDLLAEAFFRSDHPMDKWYETFILRGGRSFVQETAQIRDMQTISQINEIAWVPNY